MRTEHAGENLAALGPRHWARVEGWGMAVSALGYLHQPESIDELRALFALARESATPVTLRGGGRSYGDAAIGEGCLVADVSRMNRILSWDKETGIVETEPGVTIEQLWKRIIPDGWWPSVVSGTMFTTMAGCAAMNIHGKNNYRAGTFGDNVLEFDLLLPNGDIVTCNREQNADLFHGAIGGFGMLGCFTRLKLKAKKVHSGFLRVEAFNTRSIPHMIEEFEERVEDADYLVGWIDCIAGGRGLGRGTVHSANYLPPGEDPNPRESQVLSVQELPNAIMGVPKSLMWWPLSYFTNNLGMRAINTAKYHAGNIIPRGAMHLQAHAAFAFLLDYVPNWKWSYRPTGLIQYQSFIPAETAAGAFEKLLRLSQKAGLPSYLGVFKKHRPDPFLMTHALDGYSLALDFRVTPRNRAALWNLCHRMDDVVLDAGGRFYFAKDATLRPHVVEQYIPADNLRAFIELKHRCDPHGLLQTDLSRRLFGEQFA
ncbi:MAG: decaprenylphospho-beta-D-ribofuranose 2-oxidase [Candidatus Sumerlaeota bacterium]|nr:decaprenylphospho-beta-D-ribofuranose 2-oxidase [Candidatus Sumerlaeota bacterium]